MFYATEWQRADAKPVLALLLELFTHKGGAQLVRR